MSPKHQQNTERINVFLSKEILDNLKDAALKRGTNVSALSRFIIIQWLLEQNILDSIGREIIDGPNNQSAVESKLNELNRIREYGRYRIYDND